MAAVVSEVIAVEAEVMVAAVVCKLYIWLKGSSVTKRKVVE